VSDAARVLAGLRQPDRLSCGATAVVGWRMLTDPAYADRVRGREAQAVLATHRSLVSPHDEAGRWQVPWPRGLGTPPWSLARAVDGRVRWATWGRLTDAVAAGSPAALYVGPRALPLHVVLAIAGTDDVVVVHDPARGGAVRLDRTAFEAGRLPFAGRPRPWWLVSRQR